MAESNYNIGQFSRLGTGDLNLTSKRYSKSTIHTKAANGTVYDDVFLACNTDTLNSNEHCYLQFNISRQSGYAREFSIYVVKRDTSATATQEYRIINIIDDSLIVPAGSGTYTFTYCFVPRENDCIGIAFVQKRISGQASLTTAQVTSIKLGTLTNLFDSVSIDGTVLKVGIQGKPYELFAINGDGFRLPASGLLEINVKVAITFIAPATTDWYVIDYAWSTSED